MDKRYSAMAAVPENAKSPIGFGKLKGKSDINPQWRYETLTEQFGLCGVGWRFEIVSTQSVPVPATGELLLYMQVNLYIKDGENWSEAIPGMGGDFILQKDKNGLHGNDEAYKMALTDALGNAAKMVGVAADIYRGKYDTKYNRQAAPQAAPQAAQTQQAPTIKQQTAELLRNFGKEANQAGIDNAVIGEVIWFKYRKKSKDLSMAEASELINNFEQFRNEMFAAEECIAS